MGMPGRAFWQHEIDRPDGGIAREPVGVEDHSGAGGACLPYPGEPTLRSRSRTLQVPFSASPSRILSAVARTPRVPRSHHQGRGSLSPVCTRHPTASPSDSPEYSYLGVTQLTDCAAFYAYEPTPKYLAFERCTSVQRANCVTPNIIDTAAIIGPSLILTERRGWGTAEYQVSILLLSFRRTVGLLLRYSR